MDYATGEFYFARRICIFRKFLHIRLLFTYYD